jgi:hypothetical protein
MNEQQIKAIIAQSDKVSKISELLLLSKQRQKNEGRHGFKDPMFGTIFMETESSFEMRKQRLSKVEGYLDVKLQNAIEHLTSLT